MRVQGPLCSLCKIVLVYSGIYSAMQLHGASPADGELQCFSLLSYMQLLLYVNFPTKFSMGISEALPHLQHGHNPIAAAMQLGGRELLGHR